MKGEIETRLEMGIQAAKAGEAKRAREILTYVIQQDQYNEQAWLWLSSVVDNTADKRVCLENVLFINPKNSHAATGLQRLRQHLTDYLTSSPTLPSVSAPQTPDTWGEDEEEDDWEWAGHTESESEKKWAWDASDTSTSSQPIGQDCARCGYRNPGWVYICDRCGADLQPVDLRTALSSGAKPRGRSPITLLAAWGGTFTFNRLLAFQPEIELASWGRSLSALVLTALFISVWRAFAAVMPQLTSPAGRSWQTITTPALQCVIETLPSALFLILFCVPVVLLTWVAASLAGGKHPFKTHAHLTIIAFSTWLILIALLMSLPTLIPQLQDLSLPIEGASTWIGGAVSLIGVIWLIQALRTAHHLSMGHTILAALLVTVLGGAILFGLDWLASDRLAEFVNALAVPFSPWPG
ncbi:MAG: hypothetical protein GY832_30375 [Chloroflexi bacterium]|nr:hypothetical protein [Chloroflexota bacterium]